MKVEPQDLKKVMDRVTAKAQTEWMRLTLFENYFRGAHSKPFEPKTATAEFKSLVHKSTTNLTRLVVNTVTQRLIVDGFKASKNAAANAPQWTWWQGNGLDAAQKPLYDEVGKFGYAFMLVLPGKPFPVMLPRSPLTWFAEFDDFADDVPVVAVRRVPNTEQPEWVLLDDERAVNVRRKGEDWVVVDGTEVGHDLGEVPLVVYRNELCLTGWPMGEIEPVIPIQDRLNQTVFDLLVAQTYAAAPQKYIAGLSVPTDEAGEPIIDIKAFAKSVWTDPNENARFGSLPEANLANIVRAIDSTLRIYGLMSQTPPHYLLGDLVNLSAEALLAADSTLAKKVQNRQAILGESHERMFRLAAKAMEDPIAEDDQEAQVWWRDTEPRSIAQVTDALGKMAQMLGVPQESLWEMIPGITRTTLDEWKANAARLRLRAAVQQPQIEQAPQDQPPAVPAGNGAR